MPIVDVKVMEKVLSPKQQQSIAEGNTQVFADVVGEPVRRVTWVVIQDVTSGQWTMGGRALATEGVQEMLGREKRSWSRPRCTSAGRRSRSPHGGNRKPNRDRAQPGGARAQGRAGRSRGARASLRGLDRADLRARGSAVVEYTSAQRGLRTPATSGTASFPASRRLPFMSGRTTTGPWAPTPPDRAAES